jgi:hypothetical protein
MAGTEHVPRTQNAGRDAAGADQRFAFRARGDVGAHHRRRLRDAEINEVRYPGLDRRGERRACGSEIDAAERLGLCRTRMRHADKMNQRIDGTDLRRITRGIERVADNDATSRCQPLYRGLPRQRGNAMAARHQFRNQTTADVAGGAGHEDVHADLPRGTVRQARRAGSRI